MKAAWLNLRLMSTMFPLLLSIGTFALLVVAMIVTNANTQSTSLQHIAEQIQISEHRDYTINTLLQQDARILAIEFVPAPDHNSDSNSWFVPFDDQKWLKVSFSEQRFIAAQWLVPGLALALMSFMFWFISWLWFKHRLQRPLLALNNRLNEIINSQGFDIRVPVFYHDETGELINVMNRLLDHVHNHDIQLKTEKVRAELAQNKLQKSAQEMMIANQKLEKEVEIRAKIEQKLSSTQSYLNSILNSLSSAVIAINEQGIISHWNIAASRMTDVPMERALGFKPIDVNPILAKCDEWISQGMINRTSISQDRIAFEVSGITKILDIRVYPLQKSGTKGVVLRLEDNSEKHKMEEIIVQTEKMMSVGGLAAGMAHEINNPLGAIMQNSQNIIRRLSPSLKRNQTTAEMIGIDLELLNHYIEQRGIFRFLDNIADAGERATLIVRNMLQFSRMGTTTKEIRDIKELIERTIQIAQSDFALKEDSDIEISQDDIPSISLSCIGVEIEQVLLNIIKNSIHAIEIRQRTDSFKGQIAISVQHNAQQIQIHLKDNGIGMDRATKKRIFEPFYTTKEVGSGTGLGLSVSYFIIHSHHGGQLRVNSELNKGTEFVISLPIT